MKKLIVILNVENGKFKITVFLLKILKKLVLYIQQINQ